MALNCRHRYPIVSVSYTPLLAGVGKVLLYEVPSLSVPGGSGAMRLGYRSFTYLLVY